MPFIKLIHQENPPDFIEYCMADDFEASLIS
jgi:hypothetical protein